MREIPKHIFSSFNDLSPMSSSGSRENTNRYFCFAEAIDYDGTFHLVVLEGLEPSKVEILSLYAVPFATNPQDHYFVLIVLSRTRSSESIDSMFHFKISLI